MTETAAETGQLAEHAGLRLKIYRVNPKTLARSEAVEIQARPSKRPMVSHAFPPCECARCGGRRGAKR